MSQLKQYVQAMIAGQLERCIQIEIDHDLHGYPPEVVTTGLKAFDEGRSVQDAVAEYLAALTEEAK